MYYWEGLGDKIVAATTGRGTGVVGNCSYSGFNICPYVGDNRRHIDDCLSSLAAQIGLPVKNIIYLRQVHSTEVIVIDRIADFSDVEADALVTRLTDVAIGIFTADCLPILLADSHRSVIAAIHAGWRGLLAGIVSATIEKMSESGAFAPEIHAVIAPTIGKCCFEVGEEVAAIFHDYGYDDFIDRNFDKPHIDLPAIAQRQLLDGNLNADNIKVSGICTKCNPDRFFSARAYGIKSGRNYSFIYKKNSH